MRYYYPITFIAVFLLCSCNNHQSVVHGAIELGESATIITETDSQYLQDLVADIQPIRKYNHPKEIHTDSVKPAQQPEAQGLNVDFKDINILIPNIETRSFGQQNENSAAFQIVGGNLAGNKLIISGGTIEEVTQRYATAVMLNSERGNLVLDDLDYSSDWKELKGNKNNFIISGLEKNKLSHTSANASTIREAVRKALRRKRESRRVQSEYLNDIRGVRSVTQKPLEVILRYVIWQIKGKDNIGKSFHKELRIDMSI